MRYLLTLFVASSFTAPGCGDEGGGVYCCTYESRRSACGGGDYTAWETNSFEFNIDDYVAGWSPEDVCDMVEAAGLRVAGVEEVAGGDRDAAAVVAGDEFVLDDPAADGAQILDLEILAGGRSGPRDQQDDQRIAKNTRLGLSD